ncbi:diacylglycerol/polyprenol kinase family protein [Candidatus Undinarchaeota archaeon]
MSEFSLKKEIQRKLVHFLSILILPIYLYFDKTVGLLLLTFILILLIEIEYFRVEWGKKIPIFGSIFRSKEKDRMGGEVFFLIGAIICLAVFNEKIAIAAILMTTFGDAAAAIFGKAFGTNKIPKLNNKTVEGFVAELGIDMLIAYFLLSNWIVILVMALTATIVETLSDKLDDNLIIPIFAGFNGHIALYLLALFA